MIRYVKDNLTLEVDLKKRSIKIYVTGLEYYSVTLFSSINTFIHEAWLETKELRRYKLPLMNRTMLRIDIINEWQMSIHMMSKNKGQ